ncbi:hypothetical protein [Erwinia tracheiphila]
MKHDNKVHLADYIDHLTGIEINPDALFDV